MDDDITIYLDGGIPVSGAGAGAGALDELEDVEIVNAVEGQFLGFDGEVWRNADIPEAGAKTLDDLEDVEITNLGEGAMLKFDGTVWRNIPTIEPGAKRLGELEDVAVGAHRPLSDGQLLAYYEEGNTWINTHDITVLSCEVDHITHGGVFELFSEKRRFPLTFVLPGEITLNHAWGDRNA